MSKACWACSVGNGAELSAWATTERSNSGSEEKRATNSSISDLLLRWPRAQPRQPGGDQLDRDSGQDDRRAERIEEERQHRPASARLFPLHRPILAPERERANARRTNIAAKWKYVRVCGEKQIDPWQSSYGTSPASILA